MFPLAAVNSSNVRSSLIYRSPPIYKSLLVVTTPTKVETPDMFKVVTFVGPILYLSVPTPIVPFISLLTNSYQLLECAKYPFPRA